MRSFISRSHRSPATHKRVISVVLVNARYSLDGSETVSLKQQGKAKQSLVFRQIHVAKESLLFFLESSLALTATESLIPFVVFPSFDSSILQL
jgi:hypothetical protein